MKKLNYFLLKLIYPKPSKIIKPKNNEASTVKIQNCYYKLYCINKARLYTDTIHTFAVIDKDNNLIDGPSYQIINNNFTNIKNNKSLKIGTPRKKLKLNKNIFSLLSGGGANKNFFHWFFDVLPRLHIAEKVMRLNNVDLFLFPDISQKYQRESLKLLKLYNKAISSIKFRHVQAKKIIATSHPYIFSNNSDRDVRKIPKWISLWLRKKFLKFNSKKYNFKRIYIDRRSKSGRYIKNNSEIKRFLTEKYGFKSLDLEDYSLKDQISIFNRAKIIIGLHGAGFTNIIFCKKNTNILELKTKQIGGQIKNIAIQNNLIYSSINGVLQKKALNQQGEIEIPLNILKKKLKVLFNWRGSSVG